MDVKYETSDSTAISWTDMNNSQYYYYLPLTSWPSWKSNAFTDLPTPKEGVEMKGLYDVHLIYAEDRKHPLVFSEINIIADSDEDAKLKSALMQEVKGDWDMDYLTFIVKKIGDVKVKEKPKEVKQV